MKFRQILLTVLSALWAFPLFAQSPIHINFEANAVGQFPAGWVSRGGNNAVEVYSVQAEGEKKFLHADAKDTSISIGYERKWALDEFPALHWQWRAVLFPVGTNERERHGDDSVLGLYVVFGHRPFIKTIKYIWSDTLPVGASFNSPFSKEAKMIVVRSGQALTGTWVTEKRDVLADYRLLFGEGEKTPVAAGIGILTDSDNTHSHAIGGYADIQILP